MRIADNPRNWLSNEITDDRKPVLLTTIFRLQPLTISKLNISARLLHAFNLDGQFGPIANTKIESARGLTLVNYLGGVEPNQIRAVREKILFRSTTGEQSLSNVMCDMRCYRK